MLRPKNAWFAPARNAGSVKGWSRTIDFETKVLDLVGKTRFPVRRLNDRLISTSGLPGIDETITILESSRAWYAAHAAHVRDNL